MKILHLSDTHSFHKMVPPSLFQKIDVVVHSGDCSNHMAPYLNQAEVIDFIQWYSSVPVKHKIYIAGNHDTSIERRIITKQHFDKAGIIYLENSEVVIDGVKFYGSPHTPTFGSWAFMKARDKMHAVWQAVPEDTDVLISHGPPKGIRDLSYDRQNNLEMCGCLSLAKRCFELKDTLKLVCFGHIHNMKGIDTNQGTSQYDRANTVFSNAACVIDGRFDLGLTSFGNVITI